MDDKAYRLADSSRDWFNRSATESEDQYEDQGLRGRQVRKRTSLTYEYLEDERLPAGARILDLGCGPGILAEGVASRGFSVYGADFSSELLIRARARLSRFGAPARHLVHSDAHRIPFKDGTFDAVLCIGVLSWVLSPELVQREIARVLRPGGVVILTALNRYCAENVFDPLFWWRQLVPGTLRGGLGNLIRHSEALAAEPPVTSFGIRQMRQMLVRSGLRTARWRTIRFGPLRFLGRHVLPSGLELMIDSVLDRVWWLPPIRQPVGPNDYFTYPAWRLRLRGTLSAQHHHDRRR